MSVLLFWEESTSPAQQNGTWSPYAYIVASVSGSRHGGLRFFDETGLNPLPVGVMVSIYPAFGPRTAQTLVGSGFIGIGGYVNITLQPNVQYVAIFNGSQAPLLPAYFTSGT